MEKVRLQFNVPNLHINPKALRSLEKQPWLGNIRELEHSLTRAALRAIQEGQQTITLAHFDNEFSSVDVKNTSNLFPEQSQSMRELVESYQKQLIHHSYEKMDKNWSKAAQFLQMDRGNLYRMGKKFQIH